ncbi:MAG: hypothetical protein KAS32_22205 [Candidatus Peribacteraceae bacterium]|nr:hypothetical protein [Candidatus Peribacteraceae bacterium]
MKRQMTSVAAQTEMETRKMQEQTSRGRLLTGWMYFWRFGAVFVLGFAIGILCGISLYEFV